MRFLKQTAVTAGLVFLAAQAVAAGTNDFRLELISLPSTGMSSRFAGLGNGGYSDLLAMDPVAKQLLIYRQRPMGFTNTPDQVIQLPPQTAWVAPFDVDAHPGLELLMSTATGLAYLRQNDGVFESDLRPLITAGQIFTNDDSPVLISLATNAALPVISATQAVWYQRAADFAWQPGPPLALEAKRTSWSVNRNEWTMGANASRSLHIQKSVRAKFDDTDDKKPENETVKKLLEDLKKNSPNHLPDSSRVDIDGDGRKDLVVWQMLGEVEPRTDVYIFLRGTDGKLPERPTQVLHCRGFAIPFVNTYAASPVVDLRGDGTHQLVLVEVKISVTSASSVMEMAFTRGVEMALTIRSFNHGSFSRSQDASIPMTAIMSLESLGEWPFFICGDFNGDGHPDLVVRRSPSQWNIFFSTSDGRWFNPQPALTFETPMEGYFEIGDLNGDGRADIVLRRRDDPRIFIFSSQLQRKNNP
jgi:hypothetical protein